VSSGFSRLAKSLGLVAGNAEVGAWMAVDRMENWWWSRVVDGIGDRVRK